MVAQPMSCDGVRSQIPFKNLDPNISFLVEEEEYQENELEQLQGKPKTKVKN